MLFELPLESLDPVSNSNPFPANTKRCVNLIGDLDGNPVADLIVEPDGKERVFGIAEWIKEYAKEELEEIAERNDNNLYGCVFRKGEHEDACRTFYDPHCTGPINCQIYASTQITCAAEAFENGECKYITPLNNKPKDRGQPQYFESAKECEDACKDYSGLYRDGADQCIFFVYRESGKECTLILGCKDTVTKQKPKFCRDKKAEFYVSGECLQTGCKSSTYHYSMN